MDEIRKQQAEAVQVALDYSPKLINGINIIVSELKGERLPDTDEYLNEIINGLNWLLEVVNGTIDLLNEKQIIIEKQKVNGVIVELSNALKAKNDTLVADLLNTGIKSFVESFIEAGTAVVGAN
ncbi:MAG: molecular chaperone [Lachnospiraceae bacterium]